MDRAEKASLRSGTKLWLALLLFFSSVIFGQAQAGGGWLPKTPPGTLTARFRQHNAIFKVGQPVTFLTSGPTDGYQVRNYYGEIVDEGRVSLSTAIEDLPPGWYKLYFKTRVVNAPDGIILGGPSFVVFRENENFPDLPKTHLFLGSDPSMDAPVRGVLGMGPDRLYVRDAAKPEESIKLLEGDVSVSQRFYLPFDPLRKRSLMLAFSRGTKGKLDGVRSIVEAFSNDIRYFEPRNEPNGGTSGATFVKDEMKPFYDTVKSVDPALKVLGPGTVSIGPHLFPWLEDFLKAGGAKSIDCFSFHAYNTVNGDLFLARKALDTLNATLKKYGAEKLEKWQTEQGYFAAMYGVYAPRHQGRWTMLQMMVYEQYGIPKEHNVYWYDRSHGFWDIPTWWENNDSGLNPAAALMRVWSEELYGTNFVKAFDFGEGGNKLYIGSLFAGPNKQIAAFMSAGSTDGTVALKVSTGTKLHTISAFGVEKDLPVSGGIATLEVPELPIYVELENGQTIAVQPTDWGPNLAKSPGVTASSSAPPDFNLLKLGQNAISKINNGDFENWYWSQTADSGPWTVKNPTFPFSVQLQFPAPTNLSRIVVYASPPWQGQGSLLDYELQYDKNGRWVTLDHVKEPAKTVQAITPSTRTTVDTYYSDRWIFQHHFQPVKSARIRLLIHDTTWGGAATKEVYEAGGQASEQSVVIREIEAYAK
jgi:hypothetical protein